MTNSSGPQNNVLEGDCHDAKRAEQRMMMILLPVILLFITLSSPEYTGALYKNLAGVLVMSACLCGYLVVFFWSEKIVQIPV